MKAAQAGLGD